MTFEQWFVEYLPKTKTIINELVFQNKVVVHTKVDQSLVTSADLQLSTWLTTEFKKKFPNYTIVSEETAAPTTASDNIIFIDPIDETSTFCKGGVDYAVLIGIVENNLPVNGAVFYPARNELFYTTTTHEAVIKNYVTGIQQVLSPIQAVAVTNQYISVLAKRREFMPATMIVPEALLNFTNQYNNCRLVERVLRSETKGHLYIWSGGAWDIAAWHALAMCLGVQVKHSDGSMIRYSATQPTTINALPVLFLHNV